MAVATATMMSVVRFLILAVFLSFTELMIQFIRLIDRILSPHALLTKVFISCQLFATLVSTALILWVAVIAMVGRDSRETDWFPEALSALQFMWKKYLLCNFSLSWASIYTFFYIYNKTGSIYFWIQCNWQRLKEYCTLRYITIVLAQHITLPAPYLGQGFEAHLFIITMLLIVSQLNHHSHIFLYLQHQSVACNKLYTCCLEFWFWYFLWTVYFGMDGWICIRVSCYNPLILGRHVFWAWRSCLPHPGHVPPARRPYFLGYYVNTCAHIRVT